MWECNSSGTASGSVKRIGALRWKWPALLSRLEVFIVNMSVSNFSPRRNLSDSTQYHKTKFGRSKPRTGGAGFFLEQLGRIFPIEVPECLEDSAAEVCQELQFVLGGDPYRREFLRYARNNLLFVKIEEFPRSFPEPNARRPIQTKNASGRGPPRRPHPRQPRRPHPPRRRPRRRRKPPPLRGIPAIFPPTQTIPRRPRISLFPFSAMERRCPLRRPPPAQC